MTSKSQKTEIINEFSKVAGYKNQYTKTSCVSINKSVKEINRTIPLTIISKIIK